MFGLFKKSKYQHLAKIPKKTEFVVDYRTKHPLFIYRHLHKKMIEVIEAVFGGYPEDKYIFYPPSDLLSDLFNEIRNRFLEIDRSEPFMVLPVTSLKTFNLHLNYKDTSRIWEHLKKDIYAEHQMLIKYTQIDDELADDLQVLIHNLDKLVKEHTEEKNKVLKANHIYPASNYSIFTKRKSYIKSIFEILSEANGEFVSIQTIAEKIKKKDLLYVRIVINQLRKKLKKSSKNIDIVSSKKGSYKLVIS